jgi:hypothetical protein
MITTDKTMIIETNSVIIDNWEGNSGTVGDGEAVVTVLVAVLITETVVPPEFVT